MAALHYEYRHTVGFEETNLVGNVYYANHVRWQGRCREMFLKDHAPGILKQLGGDLALATTHCACEYLQELRAFDEVAMHMRLHSQVQNRLVLDFEYWRITESEPVLVARGQQGVASMRREGERLVPIPIPAELREALEPYAIR